jgi:uncharacterized protein involved in response to NO
MLALLSRPASRRRGCYLSAVSLLALGFRPFFLLAGLEACAAVALWLCVLAGWLPAPAWLTPSLWHAHEMLFGLVAAAISGFLLTAVPNWTGTPPVRGRALAALAAVWLAGRAAMALAGSLPPAAVALVDAAFLPALALAVGRPVLAARQTRNAGVVGIVAALAIANVATQLEALGLARGAAPAALHGAVALAILLVATIGGRIVPAFTANAFRASGDAAAVRPHGPRDRAALALLALWVATELLAPRTVASGVAALAASGASALRMGGWQTRRTLGEPLLWSLHLGLAWIPVGLAAVAAADLAGALPWTVGLHALTTGAIGTMVLAVMTRVALGHTGRRLAAPPAATAAYALVSAAALTRTVGALAWPGATLPVLAVSGGLWIAAFGVFVAAYAPILVGPRADGRPA